MAKLILKRFHCVADTTEVGAESPYFLTFVGDFGTGSAHVKRTRQGNWENEVDQGEIWTVNETVATGFDLVPGKTLALAAMIEEDEGVDITWAEAEVAIEAVMKSKLQQLMQAGVNQVTPVIAATMISTFKSQINAKLASSSGADDDLMGVKHIPLKGQPGELPLVSFVGGGGWYRVRYGQA